MQIHARPRALDLLAYCSSCIHPDYCPQVPPAGAIFELMVTYHHSPHFTLHILYLSFLLSQYIESHEQTCCMSPPTRNVALFDGFNAAAAKFTRGTKLGDPAKDPPSCTSRSVILTREASEFELPNGWYRAYFKGLSGPHASSCKRSAG